MDIKIALFVLFIMISYFGCADGVHITSIVKEGDHAVMNCSFTTDFKMVIWKRVNSQMPLAVGETVFPGDYRISVKREGNSWLLNIDNVVMKDGGDYECSAAEDDALPEKKTFSLDVQSSPGTHQTEGTVSNITAFDGSTVLLSCSVQDHSLYRVIWMKDSPDNVISVDRNVFSRDIRFSLEVSFPDWDLMIINANPSDSGKYICLATDTRSSVKNVVNLEVKPGLPGGDTTTTTGTTTTETIDDSNGRTENETPPSKEVNKELIKATQLQYYQEEILTDRKKRKLIDIETDFFKVAKRYFESRGEKDN